MKNQTSYRMLLAGLLAAATFLVQFPAGANIAGPYTADANTLHLWHLDEAATPAVDSGFGGGTNCVGLLNGATLGNPAFTGFGNALNTLDGGQDLIAAGNKDALLTPSTVNPPGNISLTYADSVNGAFTFEALVWIGFDPTKNLGPTANGGNNRNSACQIFTAESGTTANRLFQFRLMPKGMTLIGSGASLIYATNGPFVTFENIRAGSSGQNSIYAPLPMSGPDAVQSNTWYHVAVTYNGTPNSPNNLKFYWTLLDPSRSAANQLPITSVQQTLSGLNPLATSAAAAVIGNEARNRGGNFQGMLDEVRISKVERGPGQMMFSAAVVSILTQPTSQFVAAGDNVALTVGATGQAIRYQWQYNNADISPLVNPTATNASLILTNITLAQAGSYRVVVTNSAPSSDTSANAVIRVGHSFAETFNTGLSDNRTLLSSGTVDPHWTLVTSDDPAYPADPSHPAPAIVTTAVPGTYLSSGPSSMWIAPLVDVTTVGAASGNYTYRTTFLLDSVDPANAQLSALWAMDNGGVEVHLNGVTNVLTATGFTGFTSFTLTNSFVPGLNTLECVITNYPGVGINPTGFRMELRGVALDLPATAPYVTAFPSNVSTQTQQSATFSVAAVGSGPLTYQWYHGAAPLAGQTQRTLTLSGLTTADAGTYSVYVTNSVNFTNASAVLSVTAPPALAWLGNDLSNPGSWDNALSVNWLDTGSSSLVAFAPLDDVLFDSRGSAVPSVNLVEPLSPNSVTVDAATDYTFTGAGSLAGNLILTKTNIGTLLVDNSNNFSGLTLIQQGTLQLGNADATGTLGSSAISNNAALVINRAGPFRMANPISGTGSVAAVGSGVVYLSGDNKYTGPTTIASGSTISANNTTALGDTSAGTTVAAGGQLFIDANINVGAEPLTLSGVGFPIAGSEGALRKGGGSVFTIFGGPITLAADAGIKVDVNGVLNLTNAAGITGANINLAVQADSTGIRGTVNGPITLGSGSFTEYGVGTWLLLATNNSWSGTTTIPSGAGLQIGDGGTNGSLSGGSVQNSGTLTFNSALDQTLAMTLDNGGTLNFNGSGGMVVTTSLNNNGPLNHSGSGTLLLTGGLSGSGAVNQNNGAGLLTLPTDNSAFNGTVLIRGNAVVRATANNALGTGTCTLGTAQTDTSRLELTSDITLPNPIAIFPRAFYGAVPATAVNVAPGILNVSGNNTLSSTSPIAIGGGGDALVLQADAGKLVLAGGVTASGGAGRKLALRGAAFGEIQGNLDHGVGWSLNTYKLDSGTWTLSGANTPAGPTTVSNGVLVVSGSLDSTLVTVAGGTLALSGTGALVNATPMTVFAGATINASARTDGTLTVGPSQSLGGDGTVVGTLFVQGTLTPGASVGKLSASGAVSFDTTAKTIMEINNAAATNDQLSAVGTVTYGGSLTITNISATAYTNNQVLKLFAGSSYSGSFASIVFPGVIAYDASRLTVDGTIKVTTIVSTTRPTMTSAVTGGGSSLNLGWPLDHTTWRLLAQTNAPGIGLKTNLANWFEVPGSSSTNQVFLPLDPTVGSVFYRLVYP